MAAGSPRGRIDVMVAALLAVIAVWVVDDRVVHAEPGTGLGEHVVSLLVPLALLAASAVAHRRLRPGGQAVLVLVWGVWAIVAGIADGARPIATSGVSGDDVTAVLAGLAGVALVALGVTGLWRSRRLDERPPRRYARRALIGAAGLVVGFFVVLPVAFAIVGTRKAREDVVVADLGRPAQDVVLRTQDGTRLVATYVPPRGEGPVVIAFPGRRQPVGVARLLVERGYGVLLLDRSGEGASDGDYSARGWNGEGDLRAVVDWLDGRPEVTTIGGVGFSVGGELLLQAAARDERIAAVVSEGAGIRSLAEQLHTPDAPEWLRWASPTTAETLATMVLADRRPPPDLADLVAEIAPRPILLIRAADGNPDEVLNEVYLDRAGPAAELWTLASGGHVGALRADPAGYERRVGGFLDAALRQAAASPPRRPPAR